MGDRHKYDDSKMVDRRHEEDERVLDTPEHPVHLSGVRRFDSASGKTSMLTDQNLGDWAWKPGCYGSDPGVSGVVLFPSDRCRDLEEQMPTYRPKPHLRACQRCGLTACLSLIAHTGVCA